jgi:hypothetical protein
MVKRFLLVVLVLVMMTQIADARTFRRGRSRSSNGGVAWNGKVGILDRDQSECRREAEYMAKHRIRGHVFGVIGRFEGCGWSSGNNPCSTCRPTWDATLTGDATAIASNGERFRVRSWR